MKFSPVKRKLGLIGLNGPDRNEPKTSLYQIEMRPKHHYISDRNIVYESKDDFVHWRTRLIHTDRVIIIKWFNYLMLFSDIQLTLTLLRIGWYVNVVQLLVTFSMIGRTLATVTYEDFHIISVFCRWFAYRNHCISHLYHSSIISHSHHVST